MMMINSCRVCKHMTYALGNFPTPYECILTKETDWLDKPKMFIDNCPLGYGTRGTTR